MPSKTNRASKTTSRVKEHLGRKDHQPPAEVKARNAVKDHPRPQRPPAVSKTTWATKSTSRLVKSKVSTPSKPTQASKTTSAVKDHPGHKVHQLPCEVKGLKAVKDHPAAKTTSRLKDHPGLKDHQPSKTTSHQPCQRPPRATKTTSRVKDQRPAAPVAAWRVSAHPQPGARISPMSSSARR
jgi:hypothetical protein